MTTLNIGMVGAGFIGQLAHLMNFIEISNCKVQALAEYRPELRRKVAARFDIPKTYETHADLINDDEIDAVVVVTPRLYTGPVVLDCLKAGKHVLSEKPMTGCSDQAHLLLDTAKANNVRYCVGYMKRYDEGVELAKNALQEAIQNNSMGPLLSVHATCYMGNSYCNAYGHIISQETINYTLPSWRIAPQWLPENFHQAFAAYLNTYTHVTNLLRYLFDYDHIPELEYVNMSDCAGQLVVLRLNNIIATLHTGKMSHRGWSEEIRITFADGEISIFLPPALLRNVPASVEVYHAGKIQQQIRPCINWSWAFRRQAEAFVTDILEQNQSRIDAEEAYKEVMLTEIIWRQEMQRLNTKYNMLERAV